LIFIRDRN